MTRLGVFGGTFNPPHTAHLTVARRAMRQAGLDEVLWVPASLPPHKQDETITDAGHRRHMLEILIEGEPAFRISDVELRRSGPSYTADTLEQLARKYPDADLYLIIGEDSLRRLHSWYRPDKILQVARDILVYRRPDGAADESVDEMFENRYTLLDGEPIDVSSSEIRSALAAGARGFDYDPPTGKALRDLPEGVLMYILANDLYTSDARPYDHSD